MSEVRIVRLAQLRILENFRNGLVERVRQAAYLDQRALFDLVEVVIDEVEDQAGPDLDDEGLLPLPGLPRRCWHLFWV